VDPAKWNSRLDQPFTQIAVSGTVDITIGANGNADNFGVEVTLHFYCAQPAPPSPTPAPATAAECGDSAARFSAISGQVRVQPEMASKGT
jgi:hypothetical protein